jgi:hypothetical protein
VAGAAAAGGIAGVFRAADPISVSEKISGLLKVAIEKRQSAPGVSSEWLRAFWSSLEIDLRDVQSESALLAVLAKHAIAYGNSPDQPLAYIQKLIAESGQGNYRLLFDEANLAQLAGRPAQARESWIDYATNREPPAEARDIEPLVIARIGAEKWSSKAFEEAAADITMRCNAAVIAMSKTPFDYGKEYVIEPLLYNPLPDKDGRVFISVAHFLVKNQRLFVKTTEAERPLVLGIASVAFADLFNNRVSKEDAWKLSTTVDPGERIVKVEFFRSATAAARLQAEKILTSNLSAELVG